METWKEVPNYEGLYEVSDQGRVMAVKSKPLIRKLYSNARGYQVVGLSRNGVEKKMMVHRLVLEAFVGPCPDGMETLHRNDDPADNRLSNLRWGTHAENILDMKANGNFNSGRWNRGTCRAGLHEWTPENQTTNSAGRLTCRLCQVETWKRARTRGLPDGHPNHGTINGGRRGCRCDLCDPVYREYRSRQGKESYQRMKERRNGN